LLPANSGADGGDRFAVARAVAQLGSAHTVIVAFTAVSQLSIAVFAAAVPRTRFSRICCACSVRSIRLTDASDSSPTWVSPMLNATRCSHSHDRPSGLDSPRNRAASLGLVLSITAVCVMARLPDGARSPYALSWTTEICGVAVSSTSIGVLDTCAMPVSLFCTVSIGAGPFCA
jgi:hypothetical protein